MINNGVLNFWGCCVFSVAIIIAAFTIANKLPETPIIPSNLSISTQSSTQSTERQYGDYLSQWEVAVYLGITDDDVTTLLESGDFDSAVCKVGESYIFSKRALQEWVDSKIGTDR